jgi:uncharacterized membrane protein
MSKTNNKQNTEKLVVAAVLTALVVVLQLLCSFIKTGIFSITLVLIPIVVGASKCGAKVGAWLGFVFGMVVLLTGDAAPFMAVNAAGTIATVLLKGSLCGLCAGLVYKALEKHNKYVAVFVAAIVCPVVNTGVFVLGSFAFFMDTIASWSGDGNAVSFLFVGLIGINFFIEIASNIVLCPVAVRLLNLRKE